MDSEKIYLLAEATVLHELLDDVKGALKQALIPTLQEAGCEGMFETSWEGDPHKLVFFEIFSSFGGTRSDLRCPRSGNRRYSAHRRPGEDQRYGRARLSCVRYASTLGSAREAIR